MPNAWGKPLPSVQVAPRAWGSAQPKLRPLSKKDQNNNPSKQSIPRGMGMPQNTRKSMPDKHAGAQLIDSKNLLIKDNNDHWMNENLTENTWIKWPGQISQEKNSGLKYLTTELDWREKFKNMRYNYHIEDVVVKDAFEKLKSEVARPMVKPDPLIAAYNDVISLTRVHEGKVGLYRGKS